MLVSFTVSLQTKHASCFVCVSTNRLWSLVSDQVRILHMVNLKKRSHIADFSCMGGWELGMLLRMRMARLAHWADVLISLCSRLRVDFRPADRTHT